jgi:hypothetical protein
MRVTLFVVAFVLGMLAFVFLNEALAFAWMVLIFLAVGVFEKRKNAGTDTATQQDSKKAGL